MAVIQTKLSAYVCPSAPGGLDREYTFDASAAGLPFTATNVAPSDYCATTGVLGAFAAVAYAGNAGGSRSGIFQAHGPTVPPINADNGSASFRDVTDGTANTFIVGERTGGNLIYVGRKPAPNLSAALITTGNSLEGGGWGDLMNGEHWLAGSLFDPPDAFPISEGPCAINCSNVRGRGFHSFHPGGAQFTMADGSVQFISETASALAVAARITKQKGEVLPD